MVAVPLDNLAALRPQRAHVVVVRKQSGADLLVFRLGDLSHGDRSTFPTEPCVLLPVAGFQLESATPRCKTFGTESTPIVVPVSQ
jgi:hypothetical protein